MMHIDEDLQRLSVDLEHRRAQTRAEKAAADYVYGRIREYTPTVDLFEFAAPENHHLLVAAFLGEFSVAAVLALWWPAVGAVYSMAIFLAYLAEYMGYSVFSRVLPHYESSSVVASMSAEEPVCTIIFSAYLDTGMQRPQTHPALMPFRRSLHLLAILCMMIVVATCVLDTVGSRLGWENPYTTPLRWGAAAILAVGSCLLLAAAFSGKPVRGANYNASGVAALLYLAERLVRKPIKSADVYFAFPGSHHAKMQGMRELLHMHRPLLDTAYFINLEGVGAGHIHYTVSEGMLLASPCGRALIEAAKQTAPRHDAERAKLTSVLTNAHLPLMAGMDAISIVGLDENGQPVNYCREADTYMNVDEQLVAHAAEFAEAVARTAAEQAVRVYSREKQLATAQDGA